MVQSLKSQILEKLTVKRAAKPASKLTKGLQESRVPQVRGKTKKQQPAVAPQKGDKFIYEGKQVLVQSYNPGSGLAVVKRGRNAELIVRAVDLGKTQLNEGLLGLASIAPTYVEPRAGMMKLDNLTAADIGLFEDDFTGDKDEQEEDHDNGSNVRHDGHTGKKEVDELPTPSDTISPAYDADKPPKIEGEPLSTHAGAEPGKLWQEPDWDGYDYPADAPEIPKPDFMGSDGGNARAPDCGDGHDAGDGRHTDGEDDGHTSGDDDDSKRTDENYLGFEKLENRLQKKARNPGALAASIGRKKYGKKKFQSASSQHHKMHEAMQGLVERWHGDDEDEDDRRKDRKKPDFRDARKAKEKSREEQMEQLIREMDDMLGHEDHEPSEGETITVTLPAMASILVTVAHRMGADLQSGGQDEMLLKAIVEALAEVGQGSKSGCLDVQDLEAVARHINGEESQEIHNREEGRPDHEGMDMDEPRKPADSWPGDMEKSRTGKMKMMDGSVSESSDFYGFDDILADTRLSDESELRLIKKRAGLKFW